VFRRQIILAQVNSVSAGSERDISAIVDDYFGAVSMGIIDSLYRSSIEFPGWFSFLAELDHPSSARDESAHLLQM
jgi:hypothetical protein